MSMIGKKLGNAKKHNGQIFEHNRLRSTEGTALLFEFEWA